MSSLRRQQQQQQQQPPAFTATVWRPFQTLGAAASLLLSPLSFCDTRPQRLSTLSNLAPELIKEHRVKLYDSVNQGRHSPHSPRSPSSQKPRRHATREPKRPSSSPSSSFHHPNDISHSQSADLSSTDTLTDPHKTSHSHSEISLFTSFKATVACVATRSDDEDLQDKSNRKKSGRRRGKLADLLFGPSGGNRASGKNVKKTGRENPALGLAELEAQLLQSKQSLLKACKRNIVKKEQAERDLREVDSLILELTTKREIILSKLAALEEEHESLAESLEQVEFKLSSCVQNDEPFPTERTILSAFEQFEEPVDSPGKCLKVLYGHENVVTCLDFESADGYLVSGSTDWLVRVWDLASEEMVVTLEGHNAPVRCIQLTDQQIVSGSNDGTIRVWDLSRLQPSCSVGDMLSPTALRRPSLSDSHSSPILRCGSHSPSCSSSCSESSSSTLHTNEPAEESEASTSVEPEVEVPCLSVLTGHEAAITCLYREDNTLVTGSADKTMRQWDLTTGQCVLKLDVLWSMSSSDYATPTSTRSTGISSSSPSGDEYGTGGFVGAVQFWGHALASGTVDGAVRMWDLRTGQAHRTLKGHVGGVTSLGFDAMHVVSGGLDRTVRIWDLRTGGTIEVLHYGDAVSSVSFDSERIVAAAGDECVHVYSRARFHQVELQGTRGGQGGHEVQSVRYRGKRIVSGSRDGVVRIWGL